MAKPYAKRTLKVMDHFRKHPNAPVSEVAGKFNMAMSHAYRLRKMAKEQDLAAQGWLPPGVEAPEEVPMGITITNVTMEPEKTDVDAILGERGNRYGTFESNAKTCQLLKNVLHSQDGWYRLSYVQREAVEMMMHKISRLVNGDATYLDTVVDIAGYNQLMLEHMRDRNEGKKVE
jgi:hypothetical protein